MNKELTEGDRERILLTLDEGKNSEYWVILRKTVEEWRAKEIRNLARYADRGIRAEDVPEYNRVVDRLDYLDNFLTINETLIEFNTSVLSTMKKVIRDAYKEVESFVREVV